MTSNDEQGKSIEVTVVAGSVNGLQAPPPAPDSWAGRAENEIAIWLIKMEAHARWELPSASEEAVRSLYFHKGSTIHLAGQDISAYKAIDLQPEEKILLKNGPDESHLLILQGRPINEPVVQYGPFVMNTRQEIQQAMDDYRKTEFGGWPWPTPDQVHDRSHGRFARYSNGAEEVRDN